jgi:hypothetical protein
MVEVGLMALSRADIQTELTQVNERLTLYYAAERKILEGQSYEIGTRKLTRADLNYVTSQIETLKKQKYELEAALSTGIGPTKRKAVRVLFRDL